MEAVLKHASVVVQIQSDIVNRAQEGDHEAFEVLYCEHVDRVYVLCLRLSGSADRADELTQETFVRAWQVLGTFRGESQFSSWLRRLAVNVVLADMRTERRRYARLFTTSVLHLYDRPESDSHPGQRMDLEDSISSLPPQARMVFVLHDVEGYRHEEITEQMGIPVGTSKAQLHRARSILKEVLCS